MPTVLLGNTAIIETFGEAQAEVHSNGDAPPTPTNHVKHPGASVTTISPPGDIPLADQVAAVVTAFASHSTDPPAWADGSPQKLVAAVAAHYGCPVGRPDTQE